MNTKLSTFVTVILATAGSIGLARADWFSIPSGEWSVQVVGIGHDQDNLMRMLTFRCRKGHAEILVESEYTFYPGEENRAAVQIAFPHSKARFALDMIAADDGAGIISYLAVLSNVDHSTFRKNLLVGNAAVVRVLKSPFEDFAPTFKIFSGGAINPGLAASEKCG